MKLHALVDKVEVEEPNIILFMLCKQLILSSVPKLMYGSMNESVLKQILTIA